MNPLPPPLRINLMSSPVSNNNPLPLRERVLSVSEAGEGSVQRPLPSPGSDFVLTTLSLKGRGLDSQGCLL
jgi:hypothetical protein